jgi:hypothetical protein
MTVHDTKTLERHGQCHLLEVFRYMAMDHGMRRQLLASWNGGRSDGMTGQSANAEFSSG